MDESQNLMLNEGSKTRKKYAVGYYSHMKLEKQAKLMEGGKSH